MTKLVRYYSFVETALTKSLVVKRAGLWPCHLRKTEEGREMNFLKYLFRSGRHLAHDTVKWFLSGLSALLTLSFVLVLETA